MGEARRRGTIDERIQAAKIRQAQVAAHAEAIRREREGMIEAGMVRFRQAERERGAYAPRLMLAMAIAAGVLSGGN